MFQNGLGLPKSDLERNRFWLVTIINWFKNEMTETEQQEENKVKSK